MNSPMQRALGEAWNSLPKALQTHYSAQACMDQGQMDIEFPVWMKPILIVGRCLGALVHRRGHRVATLVNKHLEGTAQLWRRYLTYDDGQVIEFHSRCCCPSANTIVEWVNPWLGLQTSVHVENGQLHYHGECLQLKLGGWLLRVPENWLLGHTRIEEWACSDSQFEMDFRLTHPWWGQVYRYSGRFETAVKTE